MNMEDGSEIRYVLMLPSHLRVAHSKVMSTCLKQRLVCPREANISLWDFQIAELDYVLLMFIAIRHLFCFCAFENPV